MNRQTGQHPSTATGTFSRRAALTGLAGTGLAAALVTTVGHTAARAHASPTPEVAPGYEPNRFSLEGPDRHIGYGTTSETGQPILSYRGTYPEKTFQGEEIHVGASPELVRMVSVLLHADPDARVVHLTVLPPEFGHLRLGDPRTPSPPWRSCRRMSPRSGDRPWFAGRGRSTRR